MKRRYLLSAVVVAASVLSGVVFAAPEQKAKISGLFSDMRWFEEEGDVVGMEVFVVYSTNGLDKGEYWAFVQTAEGVPGRPVLVKAQVTGDRIELSLPESMGGRFVGQVTAKALIGKFDGSTNKVTLVRQKCY